MIKAVLMDIDDTLLDFDLCSEWSMRSAAELLGVKLPSDAFETFRKINISLWKDIERKALTLDELYCIRWNRVFKALNISFDGTVFEKAFVEFLSESVIPVEGAMEILMYLSRKYPVYAASNGPYGQQLRRMRMAGMHSYLSGYFISEKVGHTKPGKDFFKYCLEKMGIEKPEDVLMIGDSLSADIQGAKAFGMKYCWFNKNHQPVNDIAEGGCVIDRLEEIKSYI